MQAKLRRAIFFSWSGGAALLAALVAANALSYFLFLRGDFSAGGAFSISRGTKQLLRGLTDTLTVKVYYTAGLPAPYGLDRQYLKDLLAEYKSAGRGRVQVEFLDPGQEKRRREAMDAGVAPLQLSVMGRDKFEIKESFMGLVFLYQGKTEVIPVLNGTSDLEYDITRRIKKLASAKTGTVGFVTGHGEAGPDNRQYQQMFEAVSDQVNAVAVALDKPVPASVDALWVCGPTMPLKPAELERLKAWLASGRSLGLLLTKRDVDLRSFMARPQATGLDSWLAQWGLEVPDGFVVDAQAQKIQMEQPYGPFRSIVIVDYPFLPVATDLDRKNPAMRGLQAVSFPFASPIRLKTGAKTGLRYISLANSSRASWLNASPSVNPRTPLEALMTKEQGPFSLAGVLEGDFSQAAASTATAATPGHLILVGTAKQLQPQFAGKASDMAFFMNLLEWSLQDETLLSIRSKGSSYRPLRPLPGAAVLLVKYSIILFLPLALVAAGWRRYTRRQALRRELARSFDEA